MTKKGNDLPEKEDGNEYNILTKVKVDEGAKEEVNILSYLYSEGKKAFDDSIPFDPIKELPARYRYPYGSVAYSIMVGLFVFFFYLSYNNDVNTAFISLTESDGECETIPISISEDYLADINGNWDGTGAFLHYAAPYQLRLSKFAVDGVGAYSKMMERFHSSVTEVGEDMKSHTLPYNLLQWISYQKLYSVQYPDSEDDLVSFRKSSVQQFELSGSAAVIFNAELLYSVIQSTHGYCTMDGTESYSIESATRTSVISVDSYDSNNNCTGGSPTFNLVRRGDVYEFNLDVRTFATAVSVNYGILQLKDLSLANDQQEFSFFGHRFTLYSYFDLRTPLMTPITCITNTTATNPNDFGYNPLCFIQFGVGIYAIPIFHHLGSGVQSPEQCSCIDREYFETNQRNECDQFNFLLSLVFFNTNGKSLFSKLAQLGRVYIQYSNYSSFADAAYEAAANGAYYAITNGSPFAYNYTNETNLDFCYDSFGGSYCSMMTFVSITKDKKYVSEFKYQLQNGSCSDSISFNDELWDILKNDPPTQLTENYYECYPTKGSTAANSAGVAIGNMSLAMLLIAIVFSPVLYWILTQLNQVPEPPEYSSRQKKLVLDTLATALLRIRDDRYDVDDAKDTETIINLYNELLRMMVGDDVVSAIESRRNSIVESRTRGSSEGDRIVGGINRDVSTMSIQPTTPSSDKQQKIALGRRRIPRQSSTTTSNTTNPYSILKKTQSTTSPRGYRVNYQDDDEDNNKTKAPYLKILRTEGSKNNVHMEDIDDGSRQPSPSNLLGLFSSILPSAMTQEEPIHKHDHTIKADHIGDIKVLNTLRKHETIDTSSTHSVRELLQLISTCLYASTLTQADLNFQERVSIERESIDKTRRIEFTDDHDHHRIEEEKDIIEMTTLNNTQLNTNIGEMATVTIDENKVVTSDGMNHYLERNKSTIRRNKALADARKYALKLIYVPYETFQVDDYGHSLLIQLANCLCLHASAELNLTMHQVAEEQGDRVAYNIGGYIVTYSAMIVSCYNGV